MRAEAHLAECAVCAGALAELEAFAAVVARGYGEEQAAGPEPDWAERRARIVAATSGRPAGRPWPRWIPQMAAVLLAVVAVGVLVERGVWGPEEAERIRQDTARAPAERPAPQAETAPDPAESRAAVDDRLAATTEEPGRVAAPAPAPEAAFRDEAAPPPPAAPPAAEREAAANEARPARDAAAGELLRQRRAEADRDVGKAAPVAAEEAAAMADAAAVPPLERYFAVGRAALAVEDSAAARSALTLWRDTLAAGGAAPADGPPSRLDSADALADSLAAFLGGPPK